MRGYGTTETRRIAAAADKLPVNCHWSEVTRNSHQLAPIMLGQDQPPGLQLRTAGPPTRNGAHPTRRQLAAAACL